jgi:hypothetical protein
MAARDILDGLNAEGSTLVTSILADYEQQECEPDARELALIRAAGEIRDRLSELQSEIDADGNTVAGSTGGPRAHPLLAEARQHSVALGRLLAGIHIADTSGKSPAHVRAAQIRWQRERERHGA